MGYSIAVESTASTAAEPGPRTAATDTGYRSTTGATVYASGGLDLDLLLHQLVYYCYDWVNKLLAKLLVKLEIRVLVHLLNLLDQLLLHMLPNAYAVGGAGSAHDLDASITDAGARYTGYAFALTFVNAVGKGESTYNID